MKTHEQLDKCMKINEQIKETYKFMKIYENPRISKKIIESQ